MIKKTLILITAIFLTPVLTLSKFQVNAQGENYLKVKSSLTYIYSDQNFTEPIFAVPKGFFVKVEQKLSSAIKISYGLGEYPTIYGFMKESELSSVSTIPENPFAIIKVSTDKSDVLFNDFSLNHPYFNVPKNEILYYYGEIEKGESVLCYVYYNKKLGYIDKNSLNPFSLPSQENNAPTFGGETLEEEFLPTSQNPLGEKLQILIIVGISIVTISVVYFLFKPTKNKTDEEDGEFN